MSCSQDEVTIRMSEHREQEEISARGATFQETFRRSEQKSWINESLIARNFLVDFEWTKRKISTLMLKILNFFTSSKEFF
jgi:hypothetical protein